MGIILSEQAEVFHVPYGTPNNDGTPEANFVDLKANPEWIPVIPSCLGWPETQTLLQVVNAPDSHLMSLAADQGFSETHITERPVALTSFLVLCLASIPINSKPLITTLAQYLKAEMDKGLQEISTAIQRSLFIDIRLELQPTHFHLHDFEGWSLMLLMAASEKEPRQARVTWGLALRTLGQVISSFRPPSP